MSATYATGTIYILWFIKPVITLQTSNHQKQ